MTNRNKIPFLDLVTPHLQLEEELISVVRNSLRNAAFIGGPAVDNFEREFARFCDSPCCVGVGSGTDALRFALMAVGVAAGDCVLTVPHTFIATVEAISQAGAVPEFVDVDERTHTMNPEKLREYLESGCDVDERSGRPISRRTGRTITAIVPVHLYGQMTDMDPILALAERYRLTVIEDACQAHGAEYFSQKEQAWKKAGSMGAAAAFSFYPGKNLGACGEAGAVTCNDEAVAQKIRMLRDHGQSRKYFHPMEGYNGRLDAIQAGILQVKLAHLADWNQSRRQAAERYRQLFSSSNHAVVLPYEAPVSRAVYHLYVIRSEQRDLLRQHLSEAGIDTGIHYPIPLHLQEAYGDLGYSNGDFPISERVAAEVVSLPMFPTLEEDDQRQVVEAVANFVSSAVV